MTPEQMGKVMLEEFARLTPHEPVSLADKFQFTTQYAPKLTADESEIMDVLSCRADFGKRHVSFHIRLPMDDGQVRAVLKDSAQALYVSGH